MKAKFARFIAILMLVIPGIAAAYGFLAMKDSIFDKLAGEPFPFGKFVLGFLLFLLGWGFIGGWIFYRDRKRNYVAPRFKAKRKRR